MKVYLLQHSYDHEICEGLEVDETKTIGIYSSQEEAERVVEKFKHITGFNKYPESCFYIDAYTLGEDHWAEGFFSASDYQD